MDNIKTLYKEMPLTIKGCTVKDKEEYIIILNSRITAEQQQQTYKHELSHIKNGDLLSKGLNISKLESERHAQGAI